MSPTEEELRRQQQQREEAERRRRQREDFTKRDRKDTGSTGPKKPPVNTG